LENVTGSDSLNSLGFGSKMRSVPDWVLAYPEREGKGAGA
jgi:hypothetical protein